MRVFPCTHESSQQDAALNNRVSLRHATCAGFRRILFVQAMATSTNRKLEYDIIEPVGKRVVIRKDENRRETRSGIALPDSHEIPVITGRVIAISKQIERDEDLTIRQYDKVLFDPREAIPVELEHDNRMFVVHVDRVLAIFRKNKPDADSKEA